MPQTDRSGMRYGRASPFDGESRTVRKTLRDRLEIHLTMLKRQGVISAWYDRRLLAGVALRSAAHVLILRQSTTNQNTRLPDRPVPRWCERGQRTASRTWRGPRVASRIESVLQVERQPTAHGASYRRSR